MQGMQRDPRSISLSSNSSDSPILTSKGPTDGIQALDTEKLRNKYCLTDNIK